MLYRYRFGIFGVDVKGLEICKILSSKPQTLEEITEKMLNLFPASDKNLLKSEIESYLGDLEINNFIVSGSTDEGLRKKDYRKN
jgi:hypothetical protein